MAEEFSKCGKSGPSLFPLCGHLKAAPAVRLHVPNPADGLELWVVGSPLVPVLVRTHLKHILVTTVARVLVAHPAVRRRGNWLHQQ